MIDLPAERAVLGALLLGAPDSALIEGDLHEPAHAAVLAALTEARAAGGPVDLPAVRARLPDRAAGSLLVDLIEDACLPADVDAHVARLRELAARRAVVRASREAIRDVEQLGLGESAADVAQRTAKALDVACSRTRPRRGPALVNLGDVEPEAVEWLWRPYVPTGKLTLLEGDPGVGKTWLMLAAISAMTRGAALPGDVAQPPKRALYLTAEDGLADTLAVRLQLVGADRSLVTALAGRTREDGETVPVGLGDIDVLEQAIVETGACLVVVDPIQAYLGAGVDAHRANEVRPILARLSALAERRRVAVVAIRHLTKAAGGRAISRGLGSIDFAAAARSVLLVGADPNDETRRIVAHVKSNLAPDGPSLAFRVGLQGWTWLDGADGGRQLKAADILGEAKAARSGSVEEAVAWLRAELADGPRSASDLLDQARAEGVAGERSIREAKRRLSARSVREDGAWLWSLPTGSSKEGETV